MFFKSSIKDMIGKKSASKMPKPGVQDPDGTKYSPSEIQPIAIP